MGMVDLTLPTYVPTPEDVYFTPKPGPGETEADVKPVNLNAITYYAQLGLKPLRIGVLVGVNYNTIWRNNRLRTAYETGAAYHELWLRAVAMEATRVKPGVALSLLDRAAGQPEVDRNNGVPEEERSFQKVVFEVEYPTFDKTKIDLAGDLEEEDD